MSIVNYLGCNFDLPYSYESSNEKGLIDNFSDYELVKKLFTTKRIYEVYTNRLDFSVTVEIL